MCGSLAVGCVTFSDAGDDDGSPTPECTPPPTNSVDISLLLADAIAYGDKPLGARFEVAGTVLACTTAMVPVSGDIEILLDVFGPVGGGTLELVLSSDDNPAHGSGDFARRFVIGVDGTVTEDAPCSVHQTWDLAFSMAGASSESVTWEVGLACPGN